MAAGTGRVIQWLLAGDPAVRWQVLRDLVGAPALSTISRPVNAPRDQRLAEAIDIVRSRQRGDGRWSLENRYPGRTYFELERLGAPSRWTTLRARRVLKWWGPGA